jgi:hypothetical protein
MILAQRPPGGQPLPAAVDDDRQDAARDDAVDGEADELFGDDVAGVVPVKAEVVENVEESCPDDGQGYGQEQHVPGVTAVDAPLLQLPREDEGADDRGDGHDEAVPVDGEAAELEDDGIDRDVDVGEGRSEMGGHDLSVFP